jgi:hypothetical protein
MHGSLTSEQDANWSEVGLYFTYFSILQLHYQIRLNYDQNSFC